jgi:hypothetical protein
MFITQTKSVKPLFNGKNKLDIKNYKRDYLSDESLN